MNLSIFVWTFGDVIGAAVISMILLMFLVCGLVIAWENFVRWIRNKFKR